MSTSVECAVTRCARGVRRDMRDLTDSDAIQRTVAVLHGTMNEACACRTRAGSFTAYDRRRAGSRRSAKRILRRCPWSPFAPSA